MTMKSDDYGSLCRTRPVRGWGRPAGRLVAGVLCSILLGLGLWQALQLAGVIQ